MQFCASFYVLLQINELTFITTIYSCVKWWVPSLLDCWSAVFI